MLIHPVAVQTGVVGNHVGSQADSSLLTSLPEIFQCWPAAYGCSDLIVLQGVCGSIGIGVSAEDLYFLGGRASLPESDEPEGGKSALCKQVELMIGNLIKGLYLPVVPL